MRNCALLGVLALSLSASLARGQERHPQYIQLLKGYSFVPSWSVDTSNATIVGKTGLRITFEAGASEGLLVRPKLRGEYRWYREQMVNGHRVFLAMLDSERSSRGQGAARVGELLEASYPLGGHKDAAANFTAVIRSPGDLGDALLMILSFDPDKF